MEYKYRTILIDPPWAEIGGGRIKRGADRHYTCLKTGNIPDVIQTCSRWQPDPASCWVWLWATVNHLPDAFWVLKEIGVRYVTMRVWDKQRIGLGQYFRHESEFLLLGAIGKISPPPTDKRFPSTIRAKATKHSQKPEQSYTDIELICPIPRLEMFAREKRHGWDSWGEGV